MRWVEGVGSGWVEGAGSWWLPMGVALAPGAGRCEARGLCVAQRALPLRPNLALHPDLALPPAGPAGLGAARVRGADAARARDPGAAALAHGVGALVRAPVLHGAGLPHARRAVVSGLGRPGCGAHGEFTPATHSDRVGNPLADSQPPWHACWAPVSSGQGLARFPEPWDRSAVSGAVCPESRAPAPGAPLCQAPLQTRASASALAGGDAAVPKVAPATGATVFSLVLGGISTAPDRPGGEAMALLWGSASCCPRGHEAGLVQSGSGQSHWAHLSSPAAQGAGLGAADAHPLTSTWDDAA